MPPARAEVEDRLARPQLGQGRAIAAASAANTAADGRSSTSSSGSTPCCGLPQASGAELFFADEAHPYADVDLRGKCVLRGQPALVDSTSPRWGEKASYYSAVCLETGEVEVMEVDG